MCERFVDDIRKGGIAAMELVARDLKSLGLYTARALSFAGVEYDILEHELTEAQIRVYDAYAEAWAIIHSNLDEVLGAQENPLSRRLALQSRFKFGQRRGVDGLLGLLADQPQQHRGKPSDRASGHTL